MYDGQIDHYDHSRQHITLTHFIVLIIFFTAATVVAYSVIVVVINFIFGICVYLLDLFVRKE